MTGDDSLEGFRNARTLIVIDGADTIDPAHLRQIAEELDTAWESIVLAPQRRGCAEPAQHQQSLPIEAHIFPRVWESLGYLLPRRTRERIFTPAYHDLLADYADTQHARFRTPRARRWLRFCFGLHTVLLVLQCGKGLVLSSAFGALLFFVPVPLRKWLSEFWWGFRQ